MKSNWKKRIIRLMLVCGVSIASVNAATITNPFLWADVPDPAMVRVDDKYYMVSTTMHYAPGVPIMESDDMVHWRIVSYAYQTLANNDALNLTNGKNAYGQGSWASSIRYKDGTFYILTPSQSTGQTFLYSTKDIKNGPWKSVTLPGYHDPSLFLDDDGKNYVVSGSTPINIVELNADLSGVKSGGLNKVLLNDPASVAGSGGLRAEGSHVYKHNGYYYVFNICWPTGGVRTEVCSRGKSLSGSFETKVVLKNSGTGVAQGSILQMKDSTWMGYMFQDNGAVGRSPWLVPVKWVDDWPVFNNGTTAPASFDMPTVSSGSGMGIVSSDDFSDSKLKLEWQFNHNPDNANWSLTQRPGFFRIKSGRVDNVVTAARNSLTQRTFGPKCSGRVSLDVSGLNDGDYAGLCSFQARYGLVGVKKTGTTNTIVMLNGTTQVATASLTQNKVFLRIDMDFTNKTDKATFFYSTDSVTWKSIGNTLQMYFDMPHFVGQRFALFNYATKTPGGTADFDWFQIGATVNDKLDLYTGTEVSKPQNQLRRNSFGISCIQQPGTSALTIGYQLTKAGHMSLSLYNTRGTLVDRISDKFQEAGSYSINHQVPNLSNGRYILTGMLDGKVFNSHPVLLLK